MLYMAGHEVPKISRPILLQVVVIPPQPGPAPGNESLDLASLSEQSLGKDLC